MIYVANAFSTRMLGEAKDSLPVGYRLRWRRITVVHPGKEAEYEII